MLENHQPQPFNTAAADDGWCVREVLIDDIQKLNPLKCFHCCQISFSFQRDFKGVRPE